MIAIALSAVAATLVVILLGRFDRDRALRRWDFVLSGRAREAAGRLQRRLAQDTDLAGHAFDLAAARRASLSYDEAVRLLGIAADTLEEAAADRRKRLRALSVYGRMASAIVPVEPVRSAPFRLPELRSITRVGTWIHHLLMTYRERFLFRLAVLGVGLRLVVRAVRGSRDDSFAEPRREEPFRRFGDSLHDFRALDEEQVESLVQLLRSVEAVDRDELAAELRDR